MLSSEVKEGGTKEFLAGNYKAASDLYKQVTLKGTSHEKIKFSQ